MAFHLSQHHFLKRLFFPSLNCIDTLVESQLITNVKGLFLDSQFNSIDLYLSLIQDHTVLIIVALKQVLKLEILNTPTLVFLNIILIILNLIFSYEF